MSKMGQYVFERQELLDEAYALGIDRDELIVRCKKAKEAGETKGRVGSIDYAWKILAEMKEQLNESNDRARTKGA